MSDEDIFQQVKKRREEQGTIPMDQVFKTLRPPTIVVEHLTEADEIAIFYAAEQRKGLPTEEEEKAWAWMLEQSKGDGIYD